MGSATGASVGLAPGRDGNVVPDEGWRAVTQDKAGDQGASAVADAPAREPSTAELVVLVDDTFAVSEDWLALSGRLIDLARASGLDANGPALVAARHGTRVVLRERDRQGRRPEVALEPLAFPLDGTVPTRPRDASPETVGLWQRIADAARHPATRARFLDLLRRDRL